VDDDPASPVVATCSDRQNGHWVTVGGVVAVEAGVADLSS